MNWRDSCTGWLARRQGLLIAGALLATIWLSYRGVQECGFVSLDDPGYVADQPMVNQGLRPAAVLWAFTASHGGNWHPLTSLSHMLDCSLFGISAAPMHWENVAWHTINSLLIFALARAMTGRVWPSALVAGLFAVHPLHVESVAWISERKDVLSTFFWLLGIGAYVLYARSRSAAFYVASIACLLLGLMAKPMLVTFPLTLMLLDFWPLRRWPASGLGPLLREKIPFIALSAGSCVVTYLVQHAAGAGNFLPTLGLGERCGNAVVSYARYLGKIFWPDPLAILYPHPGWWGNAAVFGAGSLLATISALAWWQLHRRPWLFFGWAWFLVTLLPVIGFVQVGGQAMADRYSYVPSLGIFVIVAAALAEIARRRAGLRVALAAAAVFMLSCFIGLTRRQVAIWRDGVALFEHSLAVNRDNALTRLALADALEDAGRPESEFLPHLRRALELDSQSVAARREFARIAAAGKRFAEAREMLHEAIRIHPLDPALLHALGMVAYWEGQPQEAAHLFVDALRFAPDRGQTRRQLALIFFEQGRLADAATQLNGAIAADRWDYLSAYCLGIVRGRQGRRAESRAQFEQALWINPGFEPSRKALLDPPK